MVIKLDERENSTSPVLG